MIRREIANRLAASEVFIVIVDLFLYRVNGSYNRLRDRKEELRLAPRKLVRADCESARLGRPRGGPRNAAEEVHRRAESIMRLIALESTMLSGRRPTEELSQPGLSTMRGPGWSQALAADRVR